MWYGVNLCGVCYYGDMQKEDWMKLAKWFGYVYAPIVLLVLGIFLLVQYQ
jgi:hypothetical protein